MKKLLVLALLLGAVGVVRAEEAASSKTVYNSASAALAFSGAGVVYGIVMSTGAVTNYVILRDSATANTSSTPALTPLLFTASNQVIEFPKPLRIYNGLSINLGAAETYTGVTVMYRKGAMY